MKLTTANRYQRSICNVTSSVADPGLPGRANANLLYFAKFKISRSEEFHYSDSLDSLREMRLNPHAMRMNPCKVRLNQTSENLKNSSNFKIPVFQVFPMFNLINFRWVKSLRT